MSTATSLQEQVGNSVVAIVLMLAASGAYAAPVNFSFTGMFSRDDDVQFFSLVVCAPSTVTLRSYSYAGGSQANGNVVLAGGFDPVVTVFNSAGQLIAEQDDPPI